MVLNHFVRATVLSVTPQQWLMDCYKSADVKEKGPECASKGSGVKYPGTICPSRILHTDNISNEVFSDMSRNKT